MNRFWDRVLCPVADAVEPRCLVEVGAERGLLTRKLLDWACTHDATVHAVDPRPQFDVAQWRAEYGDRFVFHEAHSLNVLARLPAVDVAFIDGDHNWFTVFNELQLLERAAIDQDREPPVIALHDVGWPYGRRDLYYDPASIPAAYLQPYKPEGMLPGQGELVPEGGLNAHLNNSIYEHSVRNGVRTAIEDFMAQSPLVWRLFGLSGLNGLAVLVTEQRLTPYPRLQTRLKSLNTARFLRPWCDDLELARIGAEIANANQIRIASELQARIESVERRAGETDRQRIELEHRAQDLSSALDRTAAEREQLRQEQTEQLQAARIEYDQARSELEQSRTENEQTHSELERELGDLQSRRQRMQAELGAEIERLEEQAATAAQTETELRAQLTAAKALADATQEAGRVVTSPTEPDDTAVADRAQGRNAGDGAGDDPTSRAGALWIALGGALRACDANISPIVAERDPFAGDPEAYLAISRSALSAILPALALAAIRSPQAVLDVPCSYGRVSRALRAAWPHAQLTTADQSTAAVAFCVEQFGAIGWEVDDYLRLDSDEEQRERYDLIWSASLLTSINPVSIDACVASLLTMLRPGGVLVAAYHGRDSARRLSENGDAALRALARSVQVTGVGFHPRHGSDTLGTTVMTPQWLLPHLTSDRQAMVLSVTERGWGDHLDVVALTRKDVHHPQVDPA